MSCDARYAEAWQYSAFWCVGSIQTGYDDSGGAGNASLQASQANFVNVGVRANEGMILYNLTQNTSGPVTAVGHHSLTATGVTWDDGDQYRIVAITGTEIATVEHYLDVSASLIFGALASVGACDCTLSSWGANLLSTLNIIGAASFHECRCARPGSLLSEARKAQLMEWANGQMSQIRLGQIDVCSGATGADFPAVDWAELELTDFNAAQIIINRELRNS